MVNPEVRIFPSNASPARADPQVDIVSLHYAASPTDYSALVNTQECLAALKDSSFQRLRLVLVDSGSKDDFTEKLNAKLERNNNFPFPVATMRVAENLGYTGATNLGAQWSLDHGSDYVFLLNNDVILSPNCLGKLVAFATDKHNIAAVGPKVYDYQHGIKSNRLQYIGGRFIGGNFGGWIKDKGQFEKPLEVDFVAGAACLVRSVVIKQLGLYDPRYFIWFEDIDFGIKIKEAGYKSYYFPADAWHKGSTSLANRYSPEYAYFSARNLIFTIRKHPNTWGIQLIPRFFLVEAKTLFGALLINKNYKPVRALMKGIQDGLNFPL